MLEEWQGAIFQRQPRDLGDWATPYDLEWCYNLALEALGREMVFCFHLICYTVHLIPLRCKAELRFGGPHPDFNTDQAFVLRSEWEIVCTNNSCPSIVLGTKVCAYAHTCVYSQVCVPTGMGLFDFNFSPLIWSLEGWHFYRILWSCWLKEQKWSLAFFAGVMGQRCHTYRWIWWTISGHIPLPALPIRTTCFLNYFGWAWSCALGKMGLALPLGSKGLKLPL